MLAAAALSALLRYLNSATMPGRGGMTDPEVGYELISNLRTAAELLDQLLRQVGDGLVETVRGPAAAQVPGGGPELPEHATPVDTAIAAAAELEHARQLLTGVTARLADARAYAARLYLTDGLGSGESLPGI